MEQNEDFASQTSPIVAGGSAPLTTITYARRNLTMRPITDAEIDALASLGNSIHLTFFGISFGALLSFVIVLTTNDVKDPRWFAAYVAMLGVSILGAAYFGVRSVVDYLSQQNKVKEIKQSPPVG
jgi:hypothetical protein